MIDKKIRYSVINFLRATIYFSGVAFLLSCISKKGVIILTYHSVDNVTKSLSAVSLKKFEKQIRYIAQRKRAISLEEIVTNIQKGIESPKGGVAISFDDGYKNNYTNAYPILKKYNIPFTIFLTSDHIGSDKLIWYDELAYKIKQSNCESIVLKTNNSQRYTLRNEKEKLKTIDSLFRELINYSNEKRREILSELDTKLNVKVPKQHIENKMLSWSDVNEMAADTNVSFGAHTCSHCKLTSVSSDDARKEIAESKHVIGEEIGKAINFFSYPHGGYNERIKQIIKEIGFDCAVTILYGKNGLESDLFELKRIGVNASLWMLKYNLMCVDAEEMLQNIYYKMFKK